MSRLGNPLRTMLTLGKWIGALAAAVVVGQWIQWAITTDPFARLRPQKPDDGNAIVLGKGQMDFYEKGDRKLSVDVGSMQIGRTRQMLVFRDLTGGRTYDADRPLNFEAQIARYDSFDRRLFVDVGARVWGEDLDLSPERLQYSDRDRALSIGGSIKGRLYSGTISADNFKYSAMTGVYEAENIDFKGKLPQDIQEAAPIKGSGMWHITGRKGRHDATTGREVFEEGRATDGEIILMSPRIEWDRKTDVVYAFGPVKYFGEELNVLCDRATVYRKEKRAVLTGNVQMLLKPEEDKKLEVVELQPFRPVVPEEIAANRPAPQRSDREQELDDELRSGKTARKYPVQVFAGKVEYWYEKGKRRGIVSESPQALQEFPGGRWRRLWAARGLYDGEKETLRLLSGTEAKRETRVKTSLGDDIEAVWFEVSTKKDDDAWEAEDIVGRLAADRDDVERRETGPPPPLRGPIGSGRRM